MYGIVKKIICMLPIFFLSTEDTTDVLTSTIGTEIQPKFSLPYVVDISSIQNSSFMNEDCTGVLISPNFVLTSANCIDQNKSYDVIFHRHDKNLSFYEEGALGRSVDKIHIHPSFNNTNDNWDFALLQFSEKVPYTPIQLDFSRTYEGRHANVVGWGDTKENQVLRGTSGLIVLPDEDCEYFPMMMCVSGDIYQKNPGSPLRLDLTDTLIGIYNKRGVYSDVGPAKRWISKKIK